MEMEPFGVRVHIVLPGRSPQTSFGANARPHLRGMDDADYALFYNNSSRMFRTTKAPSPRPGMSPRQFGRLPTIPPRHCALLRAKTQRSGWLRQACSHRSAGQTGVTQSGTDTGACRYWITIPARSSLSLLHMPYAQTDFSIPGMPSRTRFHQGPRLAAQVVIGISLSLTERQVNARQRASHGTSGHFD